MDALLLILVTFFGYLAVYHTYGRFLGRKVFGLDRNAEVPSRTQQDGIDFVPTRKGIIFGHHYTSIAGTGPIVGPAIGIIWGWVPALLWVFLGAVIMGGVHDLGSLVISLRNQGKTLTEVTSRYINRRVRLIFFLIMFLELWIVIAIFGLVIALIFNMFPSAVLPVWLQIPIAVGAGLLMYRTTASIVLSTAAAVAAMYLTIWLGTLLPVSFESVAGIPATGAWTILLLIYAFIASTLPVTVLLQPRDYINAWQLFISMGLLALGALVASGVGGMHIVAPAFNPGASGAPPLWPFLFITIACGAVSGFHCIVSSGTSSKQISCEPDALFVGYGSMLFESALAVLVLVAVSAGIGLGYVGEDGVMLTGSTAWQYHYHSWGAAQGLASKIDAVVVGSANMMNAIGIPPPIGKAIMGVFIASFAGTTLDTATRTQRYILSELFSELRLQKISGRYVTTGIAVVTAAALAFASGANGTGALALWPMFGAVNQLLAALALLLITIYLRGRGGLSYLVSGLPCAFMLLMTTWAMLLNEWIFLTQRQYLLAAINAFTLVLAVWMVVEAAGKILRPVDRSDSAGVAVNV
ncbi:MAG: carbon starvation protein A [Candidatus Glassbacteria bacterium]|nr:carbon starvation protein A [Candidatus Glassbacteria bacterium]